MKSTSVRVNARYEERVRIKHLAMEPSLQGAMAAFLFEGHSVEIRLRTLPPEDQRYSELAEAEADIWNSDGDIFEREQMGSEWKYSSRPASSSSPVVAAVPAFAAGYAWSTKVNLHEAVARVGINYHVSAFGHRARALLSRQ
jgi:hypothetical protein